MSASREKKQRQGTGPSERARQAQQEQAAHKRKTVVYTAIGVVVAVLVAALLIWSSGFFQARATAATVGSDKLTTAELSYYYYGARNNYISSMSMFGITFDNSVPDDEQIFNQEDNTTLRDYFMDEALASAKLHLALYQEALATGLTEADVKGDLATLIDSVKSEASSYGYSYAAYLRAMYGPYMNTATFEKLSTRRLLAQQASDNKGNALYDGYSQDELTAYYNTDENADSLDTFEYSYLEFAPADVPTTDADGNEIDEDTVNQQKEEALAEAKATAEEALAEYEEGESVSHLIEHFQPKTSGDHTTAVGSGSISSTYREDLLALKEGEAALVENSTSGYYVVVYHGRTLMTDPTVDVRHILVRAEPTIEEHDDHTHEEAPTDEAWAAAKAKMDEIQAAWENSDKTEEAFAALANEKSDDGDGTTGGLYQRVNEGRFVPEFNEWLFGQSHEHGDVGMVQHVAQEGDSNEYYGYHLIFYVGENEPIWMASARNTMSNEALLAWQEELSSAYDSARADGAKYLGT